MKRKVIQAILTQLRDELETVLRSAEAAHQAATHEESKAEDAYDTRGLEASYLASAQGKRAADLKRLIAGYERALESPGGRMAEVDLGALVEVESEKRRFWYWLVGEGGGIQVEVDGKRVSLLTPDTPLAEAIVGRKPGDDFSVELAGREREYRVVGVE
jgi:transcription elongation GreA/GreB family factor